MHIWCSETEAALCGSEKPHVTIFPDAIDRILVKELCLECSAKWLRLKSSKNAGAGKRHAEALRYARRIERT
jgi:hypothetical protein